MLKAWFREHDGLPEGPVFPTVRGQRASRDALERLVSKHISAAGDQCPSLRRKRVTPHVLRHTAAMDFLHNGVDRSVIALWLGHECVTTTQVYFHADMALKERALARTTPTGIKPGRFSPDAGLLAFLDGL